MPEPTPADIELARAALLDITTAATIGAFAGAVVGDDGLETLYFDTTMAGYPGWRWTVALAHVEGMETSVLETELTPGEGALLSPDWVPWSERLAEYQEAQAELAALRADESAEDDADDDDEDDDDDFDDDDDDDDDHDDEDEDDDHDDLHHDNDLDGVDIDSLDEPESESESVESTASATLTVHDEQAEDAQGESDEARPEPAVKARRRQRSPQKQQHDEAE